MLMLITITMAYLRYQLITKRYSRRAGYLLRRIVPCHYRAKKFTEPCRNYHKNGRAVRIENFIANCEDIPRVKLK